MPARCRCSTTALRTMRCARRSTPARCSRGPPVKGRDNLHAKVIAGASFKHVFPRSARLRLRINVPAQVTGPLGRHARVGSVVVVWRGKVVKRVPLAARQGAAGTAPRHRRTGVRDATVYACIAARTARRGRRPGRVLAGSDQGEDARSPHDHHSHAQRCAGQDAGGSELHAGPPASHRRSDDDARRQGRQRRARAQASGPAGDRDRLRRRRDGRADRRRPSTTRRSSTASPGSARSRAPTRPCSIRPRTSTPRSTSAARRSRRRSSSCSATSCCISPRARACACSPAACRAGSTATCTPG